jgi:uncharacterized membrane protein YgcG
MANKSQGKGLSEIQMAITAIAITATLGLWNFFSTPDKSQAVAQVAQDMTPPPPPTEAVLPTATALSLRPVKIKIIYGGKAPQQQVIQVAAAPTKKRNNGGGDPGGGTGGTSDPGGGGGGGGTNPPSTGSSK